MKKLSGRVVSALFGPVPVSRDRALGASERLSAWTSLTSSLEYLSQPGLIRKGGLNDWRVGRDVYARSNRITRRFLDFLGDERTTTALHAARAVAAAGLLAPGSGRWRGAAGLFLGLSSVALQPRHRCGTDGSDQVINLVHTAMGLARLSSSPQVRDTLMWYVALQSTLSYAVSGWTKLLGAQWRSGAALPGIMRTKTYGHEGFWTLTQKHPVPARYLAHGVLALECLFPLAYARGGVLARPLLASAASFHLANGLLMGLGRFATAFTSMHPLVAYTTAPRNHPAVAGRDDRLPSTTLAVAAAAVTVAGATAAARRARAAEMPDSRSLVTRHGNVLAHSLLAPRNESAPVVVLVAGLTAPVEHFGRLAGELHEGGLGVLRYQRAGQGASSYRAGGDFTLRHAVDDLVDLVDGAVAKGRRVVLAGHSLGGEIARRAALALGDRALGVVYLDSSHPGQLTRSTRQGDTAKGVTRAMRQHLFSLRAGLGVLLVRPWWVHHLPPTDRPRAFAEYADARLWKAGIREWTAAEAEFRRFSGELPEIDSHALVISARRTVDEDPEHLLLHDELAEAHRGPGRVVRTAVLEGADHETMLLDAGLGSRLGRQVLTFVDEITRAGKGDRADVAARTEKEDLR